MNSRLNVTTARYSSHPKNPTVLLIFANAAYTFDTLNDEANRPRNICGLTYAIETPIPIPISYSVTVLDVPKQWDGIDVTPLIKNRYISTANVMRIFNEDAVAQHFPTKIQYRKTLLEERRQATVSPEQHQQSPRQQQISTSPPPRKCWFPSSAQLLCNTPQTITSYVHSNVIEFNDQQRDQLIHINPPKAHQSAIIPSDRQQFRPSASLSPVA
ncbi:unnamed protein product [Didymodactylos carnosus]|uniref:Uncharacterized protein n=1 Tax=Didymodactylos carnosus TaxID=1234261 RepID=A0A815F6V9_9BILA|nr:unnamed protein product [Didymodactylos carnosus]CAF1325119.1 unnamed protein product [Didymodactylos carnosus]CAF4070509.1 unnamed protein product [Didymodactylos carnosus]CAF4174257.1 unnamed protein product [Didymodactylos carnosus]